MNINKISILILFSASAITSIYAQAAVDGSVEVKFQSSITSASCDIGVYDENDILVSSSTIVLPSITSSDVGTTIGAVGDSVTFKIGPADPTACFNNGAVTGYQIVATGSQVGPNVLQNSYTTGPSNIGVELLAANGSPVLDTPIVGSVAAPEDTLLEFTGSLYHTDATAPVEGLIGASAVFTTAYN
ncbi:hypothetical protein BOO91_20045 [Vibrio navarrensis]|uniref:Type 1 fimbrial protein n=1 Tax=Vibrio navarrensis TaxID=29495 RepID=A0AAJ4IA37_9VIBR|nr:MULTISPECIES: fimbrial protein [Vibrio]KJR30113.1 hypothetical protein UF06_09755 [Vibrio sp. S234-5]MBE3654573.1 hypothetical protein [Vibrio navarrensis]MBE3658591.1 hypothetical protein [Vibrio navarrensis]MBE3663218.1 hypothetical protein [Vibrio navarrensis]MBE4605680.1 hypothetical protein [Vibrio navarrensis]